MIARRTGIAPTVAAAAASVLLASGGLLASAFTAYAADTHGPFDETFTCSFEDGGPATPSTFTTRVVVNVPSTAVVGELVHFRVAVSADQTVLAPVKNPPAELTVRQALLVRVARSGATPATTPRTAVLPGGVTTVVPNADGRIAMADEFTTAGPLDLPGTYSVAPIGFELVVAAGDTDLGKLTCTGAPGDNGETVVVAPKQAPASATPSEQRTLQQDVQGGVKDAGTGTPTPTATGTATATATTGSSGTSSASGGDLAHTGGGGPGLTAFALFTASLLLAGLAVILALPGRRRRRAQT